MYQVEISEEEEEEAMDATVRARLQLIQSASETP